MDVGELAQYRRREELDDRKDRDQKAEQYISMRHRYPLRQEIVWRIRIRQELRQDRDQDAVGDEIEEYRQEDDRQCSAGCVLHDSGMRGKGRGKGICRVSLSHSLYPFLN